ncbi:Adenosylhomocysteinase [Actinacidiphila cocklensis]|uniref:Adenosylhomocysteinase n=1 Tax=Actinacidiphila cocklensis TaxID=887465 RepID=A0A9W4DUJ1_9ACTN|nr:Adenosylhomocysteinase [Actinacidiphila cocklensis]
MEPAPGGRGRRRRAGRPRGPRRRLRLRLRQRVHRLPRPGRLQRRLQRRRPPPLTCAGGRPERCAHIRTARGTPSYTRSG